MFKREKSLADLQEEDERLDNEISVDRKRVLKQQLEAKLGRGSSKRFSSNGRSVDWQRIRAWLKNN